MRIGLTYDLRADYLAAGFGEEETAEFDRPDTVGAIESALQTLGHKTDRIGHACALARRLAAGDRWDLVFNIAEGIRGISRETQVPAMLEAFQIPYTFSDPLVAGLTLHKAMTKRVIRDLGLPTAPFCVVSSPAEVSQVDLPFPVFAKPLAEGTAKGIDGRSRIDARGDLKPVVTRLLTEFQQPVLVETYLPGREFTVGITGTGADAEALATLEIELLSGAEPHSYTYVNKEKCEELCRYTIAPQQWADAAEELSLAAWRGLECRDGGRVDLRADADGRLQIMELNPLPGLHPQHSDLPIICNMIGLPYLELIERIVSSAATRCTAPDPRLAELLRQAPAACGRLVPQA